jgi:signal transduction histidine kinase
MSSGWKVRLPEVRTPGYLGRRFGNLQLRLKLIILHNLFFLVLSGAVYFTVFPLLEQRVQDDMAREVALCTVLFEAEYPWTGRTASTILHRYSFQEGSARALEISAEIRQQLDDHPGTNVADPGNPESLAGTVLYRRLAGQEIYRKIRMPYAYYERSLDLVRIALFTVLGIIYILAVLLLESVIMPLYVYRPLNAMLNADHASQTGDRAHEIIPAEYVPGDEIGHIMRSRNETVAELRRQEDELERALERLETAKRKMADQDRLVSLGMLSAGVAHELNTPLAVLQGSIEKLLETIPDAAAQDRLRRMQRVAARLKTISEGLLDFSRVRRQQKHEVAVHELLDEAWQLVSLDEKATQTAFHNRITPECRVFGNADRLMQVFVNLLRNALQAVPSKNGEIVAQTTLQIENAERWWIIAVEDNGPGIPADVLPDIFEAFISTKLDSKGTGLGLTVSEGIVQQHGGTIGASNRPGGGARLEIRLPEAPVTIDPNPVEGGNVYAR